jgi:hypothetical protein
VLDIYRARALSGESVDVQDVFGRFTLDAAGEFLFGTTKLNTLDLPLPRPGEASLGAKGTLSGGDYGDFVNAFEQIQSIVVKRTRRSWLWPLFELFTDAMAKYNKAIDDWASPYIYINFLIFLIEEDCFALRSHPWSMMRWKRRKRGAVRRSMPMKEI